MQGWRSRLRFRRVENQALHSYCGDQNVEYPFKVMTLRLEQDFVNNLYFEKDDLLLIAMESGIVVLFSISRNKPISILQADEWVSSVLLTGSLLWTAGKKRQIQAQHFLTGNSMAKLQAETGVDGYPESGILFQRTHIADYFLANTGYMTFILIHSRTRKILRIVNLQNHQTGAHIHTGILKEFFVSHQGPTIYYISTATAYYSLHSFNYLRMKEQQVIALLPQINTERFRVDGYHLLVSKDERLIVVLFQMTNRSTQHFFTYATILTRSTQPRDNTFNIRRVVRCPHITDRITCKQFCDNEFRANDKLVFAVGLQQGFTQTYAIDPKTLDIQVVELLSKSDQMITSHLVVKNVSFSSSLNGEITALDIRDCILMRLGSWESEKGFILVSTEM